MAWLRAFSQPVPEAWALREEAEANAANLQLDLVLEEQLEEQGDFEAEDLSFAEELTQMSSFKAVRRAASRVRSLCVCPYPRGRRIEAPRRTATTRRACRRTS